MRSLVFVIAGIALWALAIGIAKWQQVPLRQALVFFCGIWFAVALINMWLGVTTAGYSVMEELPFFFMLFLLPAGLAILSYRLFLSKT